MTGLKNVRNRRDDALARVSWDRLESMLADYYRGQGWQVEHVGTGAGRNRFDGGIDLRLRRGDEYVLVQSKHWNAKQVTHNAVHELLGIKVNENATGAIVVTSGEFTSAALQAATRQNHVELIDGDALRIMLGPQLDTLATTEPPPLPGAPRHRRKRQPPSRQQRIAGAIVFVLLLVAMAYAGFRLLTAPFASRPIVIDLPQRVVPLPRSPSPRPAAPQPASPASKAEPSAPIIQEPMTGEQLEDWKRKNAESMRILEENERREAESR